MVIYMKIEKYVMIQLKNNVKELFLCAKKKIVIFSGNVWFEHGKQHQLANGLACIPLAHLLT